MSNKITSVGLVGFGSVGSSMAAMFTGNGYRVVAFEKKEFISNGLEKFRSVFAVLEGRGLVTAEQAKKCESMLAITSDYAEFADIEVVFECIFEDLEMKLACYREIEKNCKNLKALASTTSAISPEDLKEGLSGAPEKVLVAHPFNPPHLIPFVEMVKSAVTSKESARLVYSILEDCGRKVCVMEKCAPGFIANRLQHALLREAMYMAEQGMASPGDIDKALKYSFMPRYTSVGLFEHQDAFGLDMVQNVQNYMFPHLCDKKMSMEMVNKSVEKGAIGQRTGQGTYTWTKEDIERFRHDAAEPYWKYFNWKLPAED